MKYTQLTLLLLLSSYLWAAAPTTPTWANPGTVNNQVINGQTRYWVETEINNVTFKFWYIDVNDSRTNGEVDLGTRLQYSVRSELPKLGAEASTNIGHKGSAGGPFEYHPEGQDIWSSQNNAYKNKGYRTHELNYDKVKRPLYMLTDGVESIISGVRAYEFHLDTLELFMGEEPAAVLASIDANYINTATASNATISGAVLRPLTVKLSKSYWMLEGEVSMEQWNAVMNAQPSNWPATPLTLGYADYTWNNTSKDPVVFITSKEMEDFISAVNTALGIGEAQIPSEAEWEYACRIPNRDKASSSAQARERGWSDQDMPFAYGMHLYDPMKFYFVPGSDLDGGGNVMRRPRSSGANTFWGVFDYRFTFSYNLPNFRPTTAGDNEDVDGTAHYTRGYANHELNIPEKPAHNPGGSIQLANPKQNDWGLTHMHGNVAEMVRDIWDGASPHDEQFSKTGTATDYEVDFSSGAAWKMRFHPTKGGSWMSGGSQCRASARGRLLQYDLNKYPLINPDGSVDASKADPRCYTDTVGIRPIIYEP